MDNSVFTARDVRVWLRRRPGTFEADTEGRCWRAATDHFRDERGFNEGEKLDFQMMVEAFGYAPRPTALGGYILDKVSGR